MGNSLMCLLGVCAEAYTPAVKANSVIDVNLATLPNFVFSFNRGIVFPL